jgi:hypothetical protein
MIAAAIILLSLSILIATEPDPVSSSPPACPPAPKVPRPQPQKTCFPAKLLARLTA